MRFSRIVRIRFVVFFHSWRRTATPAQRPQRHHHHTTRYIFFHFRVRLVVGCWLLLAVHPTYPLCFHSKKGSVIWLVGRAHLQYDDQWTRRHPSPPPYRTIFPYAALFADGVGASHTPPHSLVSHRTPHCLDQRQQRQDPTSHPRPKCLHPPAQQNLLCWL
jgi:hypothetical protein